MCISRDSNHCQDVMYSLFPRLHCPNGVCRLSLLSSNKIIIDFFHVTHSSIIVWCFLSQLKSCIILNPITVYVSDCWIWVPWWLLILLMKKISLDVRHQFMARNYEVVKLPSNARCVMRKSSWVRCVDTSVPRWDMLIWLVKINFYTSRI